MRSLNKLKTQFINKHVINFIEEHDPREISENQTVSYAWAKALHQMQYPELRKLRLNGKHEQKDVICSGEVDDLRFNTNVTAYFGDNGDMRWGYIGTGPNNLAINLLYYFSDGDESFARKHVYTFSSEILLNLTHTKSGVIKYETINAWIKKAKAQKKNKEVAYV